MDGPTDVQTAKALLRTVSTEVKAELLQKAVARASAPNSSTTSAAAWNLFVGRFRRGPNTWSAGGEARSMAQDGDVATRNKKLRTADLEYDGKTSVVSYINRLEYLARTYGEKAILAELPTAMVGEARPWFDSMFPHTKMEMNNSLQEWTFQLRGRFQRDSSTALAEADALKHRFADESVYDVRRYLTAKQGLYIEAGGFSEDLIIRRIHEGLDHQLRTAVRIWEGMGMSHFQTAVYAAETPCRENYKQMANMIKDQILETNKDRRDGSREQSLSRNPNPRPRFPFQPPIQAPYLPYGLPYAPVPSPFSPPAYAPPPPPLPAIPSYASRPALPPAPGPGPAATPSRYIPQQAAQALAPRGNAVPRDSSPAPGNNNMVTGGRRPRYPCTLCQSPDHIDPACPLHARNQRRVTTAVPSYYGGYQTYQPAVYGGYGQPGYYGEYQPTSAYYTETPMPEEYVQVDEDTYQTWVDTFYTTPTTATMTPDGEPKPILDADAENGPGGH